MKAALGISTTKRGLIYVTLVDGHTTNTNRERATENGFLLLYNITTDIRIRLSSFVLALFRLALFVSANKMKQPMSYYILEIGKRRSTVEHN